MFPECEGLGGGARPVGGLVPDPAKDRNTGAPALKALSSPGGPFS